MTATGTAQASETTEPTARIAHGNAAGECALPPVAFLKMGNQCTGTLIHPQVILYAAHCRNLRTVIFGDKGQGPTITSIKKSIVHPDFNQSNSAGPNGAAIDWAVGVLSAPVKGVPIIPLAYAGELDEYQKPGQQITLAGYGKTEQGFSPGRLMWANAKIEQISNGSMTSVKDRHNACSGDSGGPVLVQTKDGSWRTIGITTNLGPGLNDCGKDTGYNRFSQVRPDMIKWLEEQTGFDLTPCYNFEGEVDKSPECKNFFAGDIKSPSGSWSNNCADAKVVKEPKLTPKGGGEEEKKDTEGPKITIKGIKNKAKVKVGETIEIELKIEDESDIKEVSLLINDEEVESWEKAPYDYEWEVEKKGDWTIQVKAEDAEGNKSESKKIKVTANAEESGEDSKSEDSKGEDTQGGDSKGEDTKGEDETPDASKTPEDSEDSKTPEDTDKDSGKKQTTKDPVDVGSNSGCRVDGSMPSVLGFGFLGVVGLLRRRRNRS